ncbi:CheY-like chemotaxis protein [Povalibacter uvarum]|uniref:CheY-like chemotaxis protein n=1 Tax=Povalibacter uvarum TaxID=732238 RepID=A0A841HVW8_9GAMM|nr:response regulator [Povalibacter uvarum]MBB6095945.1 CheY-like chemotaxis protein [Povalibacter uvarum]
MDQLSAVISASASLIWPLLFLVLITMFGPTLRELLLTLKQRKFSINVAGTQVTVEEATEQQRRLIADLQQKVLEMERSRSPALAPQPPLAIPDQPAFAGSVPARPAPGPAVSPAPSPRALTRVLWVDDYPANNAQLAATLKERGTDVVIATSTSEALRFFHRGGIDAIISDMGRTEDQRSVPDAGLKLVELIRAEDKSTPIYIYCSRRGATAHEAAAKRAGATGITSSAMDLLAWLGFS